MLRATARPGADLGAVERAMDEELARLRTDRLAMFVRRVERIGGFGGKSDVLA